MPVGTAGGMVRATGSGREGVPPSGPTETRSEGVAAPARSPGIQRDRRSTPMVSAVLQRGQLPCLPAQSGFTLSNRLHCGHMSWSLSTAAGCGIVASTRSAKALQLSKRFAGFFAMPRSTAATVSFGSDGRMAARCGALPVAWAIITAAGVGPSKGLRPARSS